MQTLLSTYRPCMPSDRVVWFWQNQGNVSLELLQINISLNASRRERAEWPQSSYAVRWHTRSISRYGKVIRSKNPF